MAAQSFAPGEWSSLLARIAEAADAVALRHFRSATLKTEAKADGTLVTEADRVIEAEARRIVAAGCPGLGVLGEEYGETPGSAGARLIIDPIDATQNFARGIPIFATLLAIEEGGEVTAGLVSAPALSVRWSAARGAGAFRNGSRMRVSQIAHLADAQLFHAGLASMGVRRDAVIELARRVARSRGFGDFYQDVLVAEGAGEIAIDFGLAPWDVAPLMVIVEEAGGRATGIAGERTIHAGDFLSSNGLLHDAAIAALRPPPTC